LTPDSIKQKSAQIVVSTRIVPGCVQFLGEEKRFHTAWVNRYRNAMSALLSVLPLVATEERTSQDASNVPDSDTPRQRFAGALKMV
jgi:hypothetical protein